MVSFLGAIPIGVFMIVCGIFVAWWLIPIGVAWIVAAILGARQTYRRGQF